MLRKTYLLAVALFFAAVCSAQSMKWYNPEDADFKVVQGQIMTSEEREGYYHRLPAKYNGVVRKAVWDRGTKSAGESICFSTNSKTIVVKYTVGGAHAMPHMPATGVSGVDLYSYDKNGNEVWLRGKYSFKDTVTYTYSNIEMENAKGRYHRYTLFLPLYNEVKSMEIGVEDGSKFRFEEPAPVKPIVAYGTSICQGACASRPGMAWTNILQRRLGRTVVNLGFSGNAMHEKEVIDMVAEVDAAVYILDGMPNSFSIPAPALQDTLVKAVKRIREKRPDTPILMTDHSGYPQSKVDKKAKADQLNALESLDAAYKQLIDEGVKNLYKLSYEDLGIQAEMMVEGIHMSDYGMTKHADAYEPILREILNAPKGTVEATIPIVQQRDGYNWMERHYQILKEGNGKHFTRVLIGDSIMHFWGGKPDAHVKRGEESLLALGGTTLNIGCGYDCTQNVLWRIYNGELDNLTADKIFLMIGTNNLSFGHSDEDVLAGIKAILEAVKIRRPEAEVTLMGLFPRRNREDRIKTLNKKVEKLAAEMGVRFGNPGKNLLLKGGKKIDESLFTDGLHPNEDGCKRIADDFR
jgi:lysophospholipase L1-like esterase